MENMTYMANSQAAEAGRTVYHQVMDEESKRCMELQEELLMQTLSDNKDTEYGKEHGFAEIKSIEDYRQRIPVQTYDDFAPYLERMRDGEKNLLTVYEFDHMNTTSGTVGAPKMIPMTSKQMEIFTKYNYLYLNGLKAELLDNKWMQGKTFCTSEGTCKKLDSGITIGCASAKNAEFLRQEGSQMAMMMRAIYTSPVEAMVPDKGTDTKYLHMRFALMEKSVTGMVTGFYNMLCHLLQYTVDNHELLINDIEKGTIDEGVRISDTARESLEKILKPMPERAAELKEAFKDCEHTPFMQKVWPELVYLNGAGGDGLAIYDERIKRDYCGQGVHNIYSGVTASEGLWSVPAGVDTLDSLLAAGSAFMEFLPVTAGDDFSKAVTMDKLEEGKIYELIITNVNGLYRYRMSDAVKVTGFHNGTPLVQFMYRVNKTISVALEKTTELAIEETVKRTCTEMNFPLADFSVYPNVDDTPGNYIFLLEPEFDLDKLPDGIDNCIYDKLSAANPRYKYAVENGQLQRPKAFMLQPETGMLYRDMMIYRGTSAAQLKPVHTITNERQRKFFFGLTV